MKEDIFYEIKDLKIVRINENYIEKHENDYIEYFNPKLIFIVEKCMIENKDNQGLSYFTEYYTECITEMDIYKRESNKPFKEEANVFSIIIDIPLEYLTDEEIKLGKISVRRIYKILQDINIKSLEKEKIKRIGEK